MAPRDIVDATAKACVDYQCDAAGSAAAAMACRELGLLDLAIDAQRFARDEHAQQSVRLSRLIGVS
jgi:hypothetical protein